MQILDLEISRAPAPRVFRDVRAWIDGSVFHPCDHSARRFVLRQTLLWILDPIWCCTCLQFFFLSTTFCIDRVRRAGYKFIASYRNPFHRYVPR